MTLKILAQERVCQLLNRGQVCIFSHFTRQAKGESDSFSHLLNIPEVIWNSVRMQSAFHVFHIDVCAAFIPKIEVICRLRIHDRNGNKVVRERDFAYFLSDLIQISYIKGRIWKSHVSSHARRHLIWLVLLGWVNAHQFRIAALHSARHVLALYENFAWNKFLAQKFIILSVTNSI